METYERCCENLRRSPQRWLVTGVAGFIGSHLLETLLRLEQHVVGLDNLATGSMENLRLVEQALGEQLWKRFHFHRGDICNPDDCKYVVRGVDTVLHQAALGSVPRSVDDPVRTNSVNVSGFVELLHAAHRAGIKRFVYASSSAVYGDMNDSIKLEDRTGRPLSPYAASKAANELYAHAFSAVYPIECVGLRYFNVFGSRQNPDGPYAAVIPRWLDAISKGEPCKIFGDGETSRDFCFVSNTVQANVLAALADSRAVNQVFNIAIGETTTLSQLYQALRIAAAKHLPNNRPALEPIYLPFRKGDVRHSLADVSRAKELLGYRPAVRVSAGIVLTADAFFAKLSSDIPPT